MIARRTGLSTATIAHALKTGALHGQRVGKRGQWRIGTADYRAWLRRREAGRAGRRPGAKRRGLTIEQRELEAQRDAQQRALRRFMADGDSEGAAIVSRALAATEAELAAEFAAQGTAPGS